MATLQQNRPPKYVVCVDDRPQARVALRLACAKAIVRFGRVELLHAVAPVDFQALTAVAERLGEEQRAEAQALLEKLAQEAYESCGIMPSLNLREGVIGEAIIAAAMEDYDASMLVLGVAETSARSGGLIAWLSSQLGSRLFIPMLLVPGNLTDQQLQNLI